MILTWRPWQAGLPDLIRFIRGLWPLNVVERLVLRLDYAVIAWLFDLETLGTYFAVRGIVEGGLGFLLSPIQTVLYAHYCRLPDVKTVVQTLFRKDHLILMGLLIGGAMVMLQTIGKPIVAFTLGPEYGGGSALLGGLTLYAVSVVWFEHMKVLAMSRGSHHPMTIARMSQLAVSVVLIYPFVQLFGLAGAGLSAGIAATVMAILSTWIFNRTFLAEPLQVNPSAQVLRS
jgi:O-antigen/teichoic acid export membrane protein